MPLLGNDFLKANSSIIKHSKDDISLILNNQSVCTICHDNPVQFSNTFFTIPVLPQTTQSPDLSQTITPEPQHDTKHSIHFASYKVSLDTFNTFVLRCRYEKLHSMYINQGDIINAHSLAIHELDSMQAAQFQKQNIIPAPAPSKPKVNLKHLSPEAKDAFARDFFNSQISYWVIPALPCGSSYGSGS